MAKRKPKEKSRADELWEEYFRNQLTPEQKAAARAELEKKARKAAEDGVYDHLLKMFGKVKWDLDLDELREDRD